MPIRLLDRFTVGDGTGEAYDIGELVTYLNDGIVIAPGMLLVPEVRWSKVDDRSFDVALTDRGRTVEARVFVDERGAPIDFETTDRFYADPNDPSKVTRCRWTTPNFSARRGPGPGPRPNAAEGRPAEGRIRTPAKAA